MTDDDYVAELRSHGMLSTNQAADRIEQLTAERDGYRKALEGLMAHEPDYSDTLWQDARAALKGESHE